MKISLYPFSLMSLVCLSLVAICLHTDLAIAFAVACPESKRCCKQIADNNLGTIKAKTPVTRKTPQNVAVQYSFDDYKKECLQRARGEGLATDVAEDLCKCTITKFRSRYNIQQFRTLVQKSKKDKAAARSLSAVGEACFDEILYEE